MLSWKSRFLGFQPASDQIQDQLGRPEHFERQRGGVARGQRRLDVGARQRRERAADAAPTAQQPVPAREHEETQSVAASEGSQPGLL